MAEKLCCVCGDDVAAKKRVKDPRGQYYCEKCYANKVNAAKQAKQTAAPVAMANASAMEALPELPELPPLAEAPPAPPADDGMLDLAPEAPRKEVPMLGCSSCKKLLPQRQVRNVDGEFICNSCFAKRNSGLRKPQSATAARAADDDAKPWFGDSVVGGLALTVGSLAAVLLAVFALQFVMALPMPDDSGSYSLKDTQSAIGVALLYSFWNFGFALIAWVSVLIAVKTGRGKGTLGSTVWKTFALCGSITIFFRLTDQVFLGHIFGILPWLLFVIRYTALDVGMASMFELEGAPRRIVALVGMLFSEFMGFLFYIVMTIFLATNVIHNDGKGMFGHDRELTPQEQQEVDDAKAKFRRLLQEQGNNGQAPAPEGQAAPEGQQAEPAPAQ